MDHFHRVQNTEHAQKNTKGQETRFPKTKQKMQTCKNLYRIK